LEALVPVDILGLGLDRQTYALFTNEQGGVLDDLIITRWGEDRFFLVVNAACKAGDIDHLRAHLSGQTLTVMEDQALLALQGPAARDVMRNLCPEASGLVFMSGVRTRICGADAYVTCSGYTGEDGFEISVAADRAERVARALLDVDLVQPVGLGARDSLRLEAGLCLYGHELAVDIDPVQAGLTWSISKARRRDGARPGGFPGADLILKRIEDRPPLRRAGLVADGKRPMREGQAVFDERGHEIGVICSACYGASIGKPIAMAYIEREAGAPGTPVQVAVRDKMLPARVTAMPFVPQRYFRG
jgi:aminomethyltransferase